MPGIFGIISLNDKIIANMDVKLFEAMQEKLNYNPDYATESH